MARRRARAGSAPQREERSRRSPPRGPGRSPPRPPPRSPRAGCAGRGRPDGSRRREALDLAGVQAPGGTDQEDGRAPGGEGEDSGGWPRSRGARYAVPRRAGARNSSRVMVGATSGTTARPHCSAAPLATLSHRSWRDPFSAGRAAASVRAVTTGRISATPSSVAFWMTSSMRSPLRGERARTRCRGDSGRGSTAALRRASTPFRVTDPAWPRTRAPRRRRSARRPRRAAAAPRARGGRQCSGRRTRAPGAASGTWKRGIAHAPRPQHERRPFAGPVCDQAAGARVGRCDVRQASSRGGRRGRAAAAGRRGATISAARSRSRGAVRFASTTSNSAGPKAGRRRPARRRTDTVQPRVMAGRAVASSGRCPTPTTRSSAQAGGGDREDRRCPCPGRGRGRAAARAPAARGRSEAQPRASRGCRCRRRGRVDAEDRAGKRAGLLPGGHDPEAAGVEGAEPLAEARHPVHVGHGDGLEPGRGSRNASAGLRRRSSSGK